MEITYITNDNSLEYKLVYIVKRKFMYYKGAGKAWPKCTQCLLFVNGLLEGYGEVIKHANDTDNQAFAFKAATAKVIDKINLEFVKATLWQRVFHETQHGILSNDLT